MRLIKILRWIFRQNNSGRILHFLLLLFLINAINAFFNLVKWIYVFNSYKTINFYGKQKQLNFDVTKFKFYQYQLKLLITFSENS